MPQLDFSMWPPQLIWLAITFGVLYILISKFALPKIGGTIEQRQNRIANDLDEAQRLKDDTEKAIAAYEAALAEARAKAEENWDLYLRAAAEVENVRKRATRDVEHAHRFALENFSRELLSVVDSLEMGLAAADNADAEALREGSEATCALLKKTLERFGVPVERIAFMSSNAWDAAAAADFGMTVVWVNRFGQPPERLPGTPVAELTSLEALPELFGV